MDCEVKFEELGSWRFCGSRSEVCGEGGKLRSLFGCFLGPFSTDCLHNYAEINKLGLSIVRSTKEQRDPDISDTLPPTSQPWRTLHP